MKKKDIVAFVDSIIVNGTVIEFEPDFQDDGTVIKRFPTLYKKDKLGRTSFWRIYAIGNAYYRESGLIDGKVKEYAPVEAVGKNIGKANETTPEQQAIFEAFSDWKHKKKQLYTEESPEEGGGEVEEVKVSDRLRPMLAEKYEERKKYVKWPCGASPKLDGIRVMVYSELDKKQLREVKVASEDSIKIISRLGNFYKFLNGIREEALPLIQQYGCVLDGELYTHNLPFNAISGAGRNANKPSKYDHVLEMYVFDLYFPDNPEMPYQQRVDVMRKMCGLKEMQRIRFLFYQPAKDEATLKVLHNEFVEQGYEGLIVRNLDSPYRLGRRVNDLLKYKEFQDEEFTVIDVVEGVGSEKGAAIFVCLTGKKEKFSVRPRGSIEKRKKQFQNKHLFIGQKLTVRYQPLSKDDVLPRFPVGVHFDSKIEEKFGAISVQIVGLRNYE